MTKPALVTLLAAAAALVGCMDQNTYYDGYADEGMELIESEDWVDYGNLDLVDGELRGDIGDVRGLDQEADLRNGYGDEGYASVEVHANNRDGAAMNLLEVWGGLDQLEPGTQQTYRPEDTDYDSDRLSVQVIGCSGPDVYDWSYDEPADEVEVVVTEDEPGVRRVEYTARTWRTDQFTGLPTSQADVVTGVVEYRP
jgi:hypothetical protein